MLFRKQFGNMANLWFLVIVMLCLHQVFARDCSSLETITRCDECIRCGGNWCNVLHEDHHCSRSTDTWCPTDQEKLPTSSPMLTPGTTVEHKYTEKYVLIGESDEIKLHYHHLTTGQPKVDIQFFNSTIKNFKSEYFETRIDKTDCAKGSKCTAVITAKPSTEFCPTMATGEEAVTIRIRIEGLSEETVTKYNVPCACGCSKVAETASKKCNGNGDYSCGACSCYENWEGEACDERPGTRSPIRPTGRPECDRGDVPDGCRHPITGLTCSDNGHCSCDGKCECYKYRPGYMFFDEYCADICTAVSSCDGCLLNPAPGKCRDCYFPLFMENTTSLPTDDMERKKWVLCNETTAEGTIIRYGATRFRSGEVHVIMIESEKNADPYGAGVRVTVPVVLGLLGVIAAAAAVAGFMLWKNKTPPLPLTDPQYQNIDAEDCTGMNPLYKPPTSSFKNPTYGKW